MIPVLDSATEEQIKLVTDLILAEVNLKELELIKDDSVFIKNIKANFKKLGPLFGKQMKAAAAEIAKLNQEQITELEKNGSIAITVDGESKLISTDDVEISTKDIPGWKVASENGITVALDLELTDELRQEGMARELVNRIQNFRKEKGFEVTDRINIKILQEVELAKAINANKTYICTEVLADQLEMVDKTAIVDGLEIEIEEGLNTLVHIVKSN